MSTTREKIEELKHYIEVLEAYERYEQVEASVKETFNGLAGAKTGEKKEKAKVNWYPPRSSPFNDPTFILRLFGH